MHTTRSYHYPRILDASSARLGAVHDDHGLPFWGNRLLMETQVASIKMATAVTARVAAATRGTAPCNVEHSTRRIAVPVADIVAPE